MFSKFTLSLACRGSYDGSVFMAGGQERKFDPAISHAAQDGGGRRGADEDEPEFGL